MNIGGISLGSGTSLSAILENALNQTPRLPTPTVKSTGGTEAIAEQILNADAKGSWVLQGKSTLPPLTGISSQPATLPQLPAQPSSQLPQLPQPETGLTSGHGSRGPDLAPPPIPTAPSSPTPSVTIPPSSPTGPNPTPNQAPTQAPLPPTSTPTPLSQTTPTPAAESPGGNRGRVIPAQTGPAPPSSGAPSIEPIIIRPLPQRAPVQVPATSPQAATSEQRPTALQQAPIAPATATNQAPLSNVAPSATPPVSLQSPANPAPNATNAAAVDRATTAQPTSLPSPHAATLSPAAPTVAPIHQPAQLHPATILPAAVPATPSPLAQLLDRPFFQTLAHSPAARLMGESVYTIVTNSPGFRQIAPQLAPALTQLLQSANPPPSAQAAIVFATIAIAVESPVQSSTAPPLPGITSPLDLPRTASDVAVVQSLQSLLAPLATSSQALNIPIQAVTQLKDLQQHIQSIQQRLQLYVSDAPQPAPNSAGAENAATVYAALQGLNNIENWLQRLRNNGQGLDGAASHEINQLYLQTLLLYRAFGIAMPGPPPIQENPLSRQPRSTRDALLASALAALIDQFLQEFRGIRQQLGETLTPVLQESWDGIDRLGQLLLGGLRSEGAADALLDRDGPFTPIIAEAVHHFRRIALDFQQLTFSRSIAAHLMGSCGRLEGILQTGRRILRKTGDCPLLAQATDSLAFALTLFQRRVAHVAHPPPTEEMGWCSSAVSSSATSEMAPMPGETLASAIEPIIPALQARLGSLNRVLDHAAMNVVEVEEHSELIRASTSV